MVKGEKSIMKIVLICIYLILTLSGLILMKKGGNPGSLAIENGNANFGISLVSLVGLVCYLCSFLRIFIRLFFVELSIFLCGCSWVFAGFSVL